MITRFTEYRVVEQLDFMSDISGKLSKYLEDSKTQKIAIRFKAIGGAPILKQQVYKITASQRFAAVSSFLRRQLGLDANQELVGKASHL